jgi:hypothetical protein
MKQALDRAIPTLRTVVFQINLTYFFSLN